MIALAFAIGGTVCFSLGYLARCITEGLPASIDSVAPPLGIGAATETPAPLYDMVFDQLVGYRPEVRP